jgi:uncharacterized protein YdaU (DUF1376 family)
MAKDPAFLFYPGDWLGGTIGMTFEEKGAYMELLMMQFNRGHMTSHMIGQVVGQLWVKLQEKFTQDKEGLWYNVRLDIEKENRKSFIESRKNNIKGENQYTKKSGHMRGHKTSHMENENENENKDINKDVIKPSWAQNFKNYNPDLIYPFEIPEFGSIWDLWLQYRSERKLKKYASMGHQGALKHLSDISNHDFENAKKIIEYSISQNYQGLFEIKTNGKRKSDSIKQGITDIHSAIQEFREKEAIRSFS